MPKPKSLLSKYFNALLWIVVFAAVISLIIRNIAVFGNLLLVAIGFGAVVLVHEFGHFILAKLSGIKVEAFSIGFPPTFAGILRTEQGWQIRILPRFFPKENDESDEGRLSFTLGKKAKPGETEYRIGLIPFGGFVKMLGQEDIGQVKSSDDPRSYVNKPALTRMAVIAAGVTFNAIGAGLILMIVFLIGINRVPAVVGAVVPDSPAAKAGLKPGDEIIEIAGKRDALEYYDIAVASALSGKNEKVTLKVRHEDETIEDYMLVAEQKQPGETKRFGIALPYNLTIADVSDANELLAKTGLLPGDRIKAVNGKSVQTHWELEKIVENALVPEVAILAERTDPASKQAQLIDSKIKLHLVSADIRSESESETGHICSMVPRLRIEVVSKTRPSIKEKLIFLFSGKKKDVDAEGELQSGDIILAIGDVENPTYKEMRDVTKEYENKELPIRVLRADADGVEQELTITVEPKRSKDDERVVIGIYLVPMFDVEHPVVAKTITTESNSALEIPRGAVITAVNETTVSSFYDVIREICRNAGQRITINYRLNEELKGNVVLDAGTSENQIAIKSTFAEFVPFEPLERLYKASSPIDAIRMGYKKTLTFIAQAYITLKRLIGGLISPKELMGPVGIITLSYRIVAERPLIEYAYFLGLISAVLAVFNLLPLLPFDGGHILFLLVEKIKGSAVSERVQGTIAYAGWVLVGALILYVTFNDIVRSFFR